jgi:hypothetical protein
VVLFRIGFAAQFGDRLAVDEDATGGDEFFCLSARGYSGRRDDFLKALGGHDYFCSALAGASV